MKLGFIYTVTSGGYDDQKVRINPEGWSHVVEDERQLWLKYNSENECVAMTLVKDGVVLAITRIIGGDRADNNVSTWVFIPAKIKISGAQIIKIIEAIKEINKSGTKRVTDNSFLDNSILNENYPEKNYELPLIASSGNEYAFRYPTGDYTLAEIFDFPFQSYYHDYKYIFIYNHVPSPKPAIKDMSNEEIAEQICVLPPSQEIINKKFGRGAILKYSNGQLADKPYLRKKGEIIPLIVEKDGYVSMSINGKASEDEKDIEIITHVVSWKRIIKDSYFRIIDSKTCEQIRNAHITFDDPKWDEATKSISEERLKSVKVTVTANGYKPFKNNIDLSNPPVLIKLDKIIEKETYKYTNKNNQELEITITGTGAKTLSPIEGYDVVDGKRLKYKGLNSYLGRNRNYKKFFWTAFCCGFLCCIILGLLSWGGYELYNWLFSPKISQSTINEAVSPSASNNEDVDVYSLDYAIKYLDNNEVWKRDSLIKYPDLYGLFEEINNYDFRGILARKESLKGSKRFKELCDAIERSGKDELSGTYYDGIEINISNYIRKKLTNEEKSPENAGSSAATDNSSSKYKTKKESKQSKTESEIPNNKKTKNDPVRGGVMNKQ